MTNTPATPGKSILKIESKTVSKLYGFPVFFEWHMNSGEVYIVLPHKLLPSIKEAKKISEQVKSPHMAKIAVAAWAQGYAQALEDRKIIT